MIIEDASNRRVSGLGQPHGCRDVFRFVFLLEAWEAFRLIRSF